MDLCFFKGLRGVRDLGKRGTTKKVKIGINNVLLHLHILANILPSLQAAISSKSRKRKYVNVYKCSTEIFPICKVKLLKTKNQCTLKFSEKVE